jgi:hypothetical protein
VRVQRIEVGRVEVTFINVIEPCPVYNSNKGMDI